MNYIKMIEEGGQKADDACEFISDLYVKCGKAAGVDSECWTRANGEVFRTYSGDVINNRIVRIAEAESREIRWSK